MKNLFNLLILTLAAIATPVTVYFSVAAYTEYRAESIRYQDLKRQQRQVKEYGAQVDQYAIFTARVEQFIKSTQAAGVVEEAWNKHHVDIKDRSISFDELDQFVAEAGGGENYYFLPNKLKILSPGGGETANPFRRGRASIKNDQVLVSLTGDYLVRVK